ncbi:MAG: hypothetical protein WCP61_05540 [Chitinophagia bacterium]|jgi:hypothetical protein
MKKNLTRIIGFLLLYINLVQSAKAQNMDPYTFNVNGHTKFIEPYSWDWSFGEGLIVNTLYASNQFLITAGMLQNNFLMDYNVHIVDSIGIHFSIGPNPVKNKLIISAAQLGLAIIRIGIYHEQGKEYQVIEGPFSGIHFYQEIPFASANTGIYIVVINYVVANSLSKTKVFKIIKM